MNCREIIQKLKNDDKAAFHLLYKEYCNKVYHFTRLYITDDVDVEEVVQDVFIKLWETRYSIDENKNFEGYLFIITRNMIFNCSRKSFNYDFYKVTVLEAVDECYEIESEIDANNLRAEIDKLVEALPPRQREVFKLSRNSQLSYKEIAAELDITEKTVERHINEAIKTLRKSVGPFSIFLIL